MTRKLGILLLSPWLLLIACGVGPTQATPPASRPPAMNEPVPSGPPANTHVDGDLGICGDAIDKQGDSSTDEGCARALNEVCNDGIDNDGDGPTDEGCRPGDPGIEFCSDGIDNDGDGLVDRGGACPP